MISSFAYEDLDSGWTLEEVRFQALNLLVGPSGAGKTKILEALRNVRYAALDGARGIPSSRWKLVLDIDGEPFTWEAETRVTWAKTPAPGVAYDSRAWRTELTDAHFVAERIERNGRPLVQREASYFQFDGDSLPRLTELESAIKLLSSEDEIKPLHNGLGLWRPLVVERLSGSLDRTSSAEATRRDLRGNLERLRRSVRLEPFLKLYFLQEDHPELFGRVVEDFVDVFPTVRELKVATYAELGFQPDLGENIMANSLALGLREEGVGGWIIHSLFSSGMAKTLTFLIETALAPKGTVLLIDELENGLGVNCLPEVAGRMLEGLDRVQYLATSHHPRVIHEIPFERWRLVTRSGSIVRVLDAENIEALRSASSLEKFTELINLPEYVPGSTSHTSRASSGIATQAIQERDSATARPTSPFSASRRNFEP